VAGDGLRDRTPERVEWKAPQRPPGDDVIQIDGHVEIRWSHGRFVGSPESKIYLDTPHVDVPGYNPLR